MKGHSGQGMTGQAALTDRFNRRLNYIRVSITDKCNFRCMYCMTGTPFPKLGQRDILSYEEILRIVRVGIRQGITKVRITGGEPLVRRDLIAFLTELSSYPELTDLSLTTNGLLLGDMAQALQRAGIRRLNISLDSLKPDRFKTITGVDAFHTVWNAILYAHELGFSPIKINVVAMPGVNDDEITDFAELTQIYPFHVRFIEYMPIGNPATTTSGKPLLTPEIRRLAAGTGTLVPVIGQTNDGPARRFRLHGAPGELGFISPVSEHFCATCNRIRLTASGQLRPCLLSDSGIDVTSALRSRASDEVLAGLFQEAAAMKHEKHRIGLDEKKRERIQSSMFSIGG